MWHSVNVDKGLRDTSEMIVWCSNNIENKATSPKYFNKDSKWYMHDAMTHYKFCFRNIDHKVWFMLIFG